MKIRYSYEYEYNLYFFASSRVLKHMLHWSWWWEWIWKLLEAAL